LAAIAKHSYALDYADESFKRDREVVLATVKRRRSAYWVDESLKRDRDFVLAAAQTPADALRWSHASLTRDRDFIMAAVAGLALEYAVSFRGDRDVVLTAVAQEG